MSIASFATPATIPDAPPTYVLVVEDEMVLRMRAVDIVEDAGFVAVEAVNADEALAILERRHDISMLFSDIQMPGTMDGLKLAHAVHERWPEIKIILVSGQVRPIGDEKPADSRFFGKPLEAARMIAALQAIMGAGAVSIVPDVIPSRTNGAAPVGAVASRPASAPPSAQESLTAENDSLRLLLEQAGIDADALLAQAGIDAKEREASAKLQQLILDEMHHRIKNTLGTVSAIASQSLRTATSLQHGRAAIEGRLVALGRAHDLLMQVSWANASLSKIVHGATEAYEGKDSGRFSIAGPDVGITSGAVIALAMTLNELCTNTTKFGALSVPDGRVNIVWSIDAEFERLELVWTETGGPVVSAPTRRSFGTRMMESLGQQLNGTVELDYQPGGFVYTMVAPLSALTAKA